VILTGATDGIGKVMARTLSSYKPKRLILPIRNREKGQLLLDYIQSSNDGKVECIELWDLDLTKLNSVKSFCDKFISEVDELHYLFNNAGIVKPNAPPTMTVDGYEEQFQ
ncbi:7236_t:CDS:2, partial [Scutellospora calospora]